MYNIKSTLPPRKLRYAIQYFVVLKSVMRATFLIPTRESNFDAKNRFLRNEKVLPYRNTFFSALNWPGALPTDGNWGGAKRRSSFRLSAGLDL